MSNLNIGSIALQLKLDDVGSGVTYIGEAAPGALTSDPVWKIKRITETGDDLAIAWADGDGDFDNIWNNRAVLDYS